ncbi:hypothetical protein GAY28_00190 [Azospirillum brasilense]|nr:hypothetical protein [Azospirillum brasilense]
MPPEFDLHELIDQDSGCATVEDAKRERIEVDTPGYDEAQCIADVDPEAIVEVALENELILQRIIEELVNLGWIPPLP